MKYCKVDGFRYPDKLTQCTACGAPLYSLDAPHDFSMTSEVIHASACCPNPQCRALVAPPGTNFCALCGRELKPISIELWEQKCAAPALDKDFVGVLVNPTPTLRQAAEMGLDSEEAEGRLEQLFEARAGVGRSVLREWVREDVEPLAEKGANTTAAQARATSHARGLKISPDYARLILKELAPDPGVAPEPTVDRPAPLPAKPRDAGKKAAAATPAPTPKPASPREAGRDGLNWGTSSAWPADRATGPAHAGPAEAQPAMPEPRSSSSKRPAVSKTVIPDGAAGQKAATPQEPEIRPAPVPGGGARLTSAGTSALQRIVLGLGAVVVVLALLGWVAIWRGTTRTRTDANNAALLEPGSATPEPGTAVPSPSVVTVSENSTLDNSNAAEEEDDTQFGLLTASTDADGAMVWIDGRAYGVVSRGSPVTFRVAAGNHSIRAAAPGREQFSQSISVKAGERRGVYMPMPPTEKPPTPQEIAREHIETARNFAQRRDYSAALEQIRQGLNADPGNVELLRLRRGVQAAVDEANRPRSTPTPPIIASERARIVVPYPTSTPPTPTPTPADTYEAARVARKVSPTYPVMARSAGIGGSVVVEVILDESGNVISVKALSGPGLLRQAAIDAARRCGYVPARRNGQPVRGFVSIKFDFLLR